MPWNIEKNKGDNSESTVFFIHLQSLIVGEGNNFQDLSLIVSYLELFRTSVFYIVTGDGELVTAQALKKQLEARFFSDNLSKLKKECSFFEGGNIPNISENIELLTLDGFRRLEIKETCDVVLFSRDTKVSEFFKGTKINEKDVLHMQTALAPSPSI